MVARRRAGSGLPELAALLVDRDQRVRALVRIDADDHHGEVSFQ
jgi:hypothetical protein